MTDAELDARVRELRDEDLRCIAEGSDADARLLYYRPQMLTAAMAGEILRLRVQLRGYESAIRIVRTMMGLPAESPDGGRDLLAELAEVHRQRAEAERLRALLAGLEFDNGDMRATGEYVCRRFQELRAENASLKDEAAALRSQVKGLCARVAGQAEILRLRAENAALRQQMAGIADRLVPVTGTLMMVATSGWRLAKQPEEHDEMCECQICRAFLAVQQSITDLEKIIRKQDVG